MTEDKLSYADAIKKVSGKNKVEKLATAPNPSTNTVTTWRRADVIDAPVSNTVIDETFVPRAVRRQWTVNKKPITSDSETQTEAEPVNEITQTCSDAEAQTIEVEEKAVQQSEDSETQTVSIDKDKEAEDQYYFSTLFQIVGMLMSQSEVENQTAEWRELAEKFNFIAAKMVERGYPVKLATTYRRSQRTAERPFQKQQRYQSYI